MCFVWAWNTGFAERYVAPITTRKTLICGAPSLNYVAHMPCAPEDTRKIYNSVTHVGVRHRSAYGPMRHRKAEDSVAHMAICVTEFCTRLCGASSYMCHKIAFLGFSNFVHFCTKYRYISGIIQEIYSKYLEIQGADILYAKWHDTIMTSFRAELLHKCSLSHITNVHHHIT
jgi:hypothetical protein